MVAAVLLGAVAVAAYGAIFVRVELHSDFLTYHRLATAIAADGPVDASLSDSLRPWAYPLLLGAIYRWLGSVVGVAQALNVFLGACAIMLLMLLARRVVQAEAQLLPLVLFALWPSQLLYLLLPATEHLAVPCALAAVLLLLRARQSTYAVPPATCSPREPRESDGHRRGGARIPCEAAGAGALIAASYVARPPLILLLPIGLIMLTGSQGSRLRRASLMLALLSSFLLVDRVYTLHLQRAYEITLARSGMYNLMMGTNTASGGHWNKTDARAALSQGSVAALNEHARRVAIQRVSDDPAGFVMLAIRKTLEMWGRSMYGASWTVARTALLSPGQLGFVYGACHGFHWVVLSLAAVGCVAVARWPPSRAAAPLTWVVLGGMAVHAISEANDRYQHVFMPFLFLLAAAGVAWFSTLIRNDARQRQQTPLAGPCRVPEAGGS